MVRILAFFVGIGFVLTMLFSLGSGVKSYITDPPTATAEEEFYLQPAPLALASNGPFGKFDRQQVQRGFQVYKEVCSACHSMKRVAFRDLREIGYSEAEVKAIASQWTTEVPSINPETGEPATRKATPADYFPSPFANDTAARAANNNALPPDLSLMTKAREGGAAYVHSLITGYRPQPAELLKKFPDLKTPAGLYYNPYFANLNLAMPPPLSSDGQVAYADGTKPTVDQMAKDVAAFLVWTAEPKLENRHRAGIAVLIFLLFGTFLGYMAYKNVWATAKRKVAPKGVLDPEHQAKVDRAEGKAGIVG